MVRSRRARRIAVVSLLLAAGLVAVSLFHPSRGKVPDFPALCQQDQAYFVAASYRAQSSRGNAPDTRAPSVLLFQDTPQSQPHYELADFGQTGAVWGLAYDPTRKLVYAGTFRKRGLPYGPQGPGGIYRIDLTDGSVRPFVTVPDAGLPRGGMMAGGDMDADSDAGRHVGKTALGDVDLNDDGTELFAVNLFDRKIYRYATADGTLMGSFDHGATGETWADTARPFALAYYSGYVYHGLLNSMGAGPSFVANVYRSLPDGTDMTRVASLELGYRRDGVQLRTVSGSNTRWSRWYDQVDPPDTGRQTMHRPQPMLTDIVITDAGTLVLGLRDRYWDIVPQYIDDERVTPTVQHAPQTTPSPEEFVVAEAGLGFGDLLKGAPLDDKWVVNTDPEYFDDTNGVRHDESAMGGLACVTGRERVGATVYGVERHTDEKVVAEEGAYWYDVPTGNRLASEVLAQPGSFQPYQDLLDAPSQVRADTFVDIFYRFYFYRNIASLGDIETLCNACGRAIPTPTPTDTPTNTPTSPASPTPTNTPTNTPTGPASPTPTNTPTRTPTPTPTPTPRPGPIYLPILLREECVPEQSRADVVLVIDASSSMTGAKFAAAQDAAKSFITAMNLPGDQVAVVAFNTEATRYSPLTTDEAALFAAIDRITLRQFTRIDKGLRLAQAELAGPGHIAGHKPVTILLTDGIQYDEPQTALDAAADLQADGVTMYAIGLGSDVNRLYLEQLVVDPDKVYIAPTPADLEALYLQIATLIPCPPEAFWGGR